MNCETMRKGVCEAGGAVLGGAGSGKLHPPMSSFNLEPHTDLRRRSPLSVLIPSSVRDPNDGRVISLY